LNDSRQVRDEHALDDRSVIQAVRSNTDLLHALLAELTNVRTLVEPADCDLADRDSADCDTTDFAPQQSGEGELEMQAWQTECRRLQEVVERLESVNVELRSQNHELAARIAASKVQESRPGDAVDASEMLSWDERKRLILMQMEEDSFDADQFAASLNAEIHCGRETPAAFIDRLRAEIESRDQEIVELRNLLDQQAETRSDGTAIGASAIADMLDTDELIVQERMKLQQLQADWEEKFREGEIEASLERAKLSRERQEVYEKKQELELQLDQLQREYRQVNATGGSTSRRWLVKLGLADED
jgi:hypothetical protein